MVRIRDRLVPACRRLALIPLAGLLSGCGLGLSDGVVEVHNHTDATITVRDALWHDSWDDATHIRAHASKVIAVEVWNFDADLEVEAEGRYRLYDIDYWPYEYWEVLHVRDADFPPSGSG